MSWVKAGVAQSVCAAGCPAWLWLAQQWWGPRLWGRMSLKDVVVCGASALLLLKRSWDDVLSNSHCHGKPAHKLVAVWKPCLRRRRSRVHVPKIHLTVLLYIYTLIFILNNSDSKGSLGHTFVFFQWGKTSLKVVGSLKHLQKIPTLLPLSPTLNFSLWRKFCLQVSISEISDFKDHSRNHIPNHFCYLPGNLPRRHLGRKIIWLKKSNRRSSITKSNI